MLGKCTEDTCGVRPILPGGRSHDPQARASDEEPTEIGGSGSRGDAPAVVLMLCVPNCGAHTSNRSSKCDARYLSRPEGYVNVPILLLQRLDDAGSNELGTRQLEPFMQHAISDDTQATGTSTAYMYHLDTTEAAASTPSVWGTKFWSRCRPLPSACDLYLVTEEGACAHLSGASKEHIASLAFVTGRTWSASPHSFQDLSFRISAPDPNQQRSCLQWAPVASNERLAATVQGASAASPSLPGREPRPSPRLLPAWRLPLAPQPGSSELLTEAIEAHVRTLKPIAPRPQRGSKRGLDAVVAPPVPGPSGEHAPATIVTLVKPSDTARMGINLLASRPDSAVVLSVASGSPAAACAGTASRSLIAPNDVILAVGGVRCRSLEHAIQLFREAPAGRLDILKASHLASTSPVVDTAADESALPPGPAYRSDYELLRQLPQEVARWSMLPLPPAPPAEE